MQTLLFYRLKMSQPYLSRKTSGHANIQVYKLLWAHYVAMCA